MNSGQCYPNSLMKLEQYDLSGTVIVIDISYHSNLRSSMTANDFIKRATNTGCLLIHTVVSRVHDQLDGSRIVRAKVSLNSHIVIKEFFDHLRDL